jgi:hypothetical protein
VFAKAQEAGTMVYMVFDARQSPDELIDCDRKEADQQRRGWFMTLGLPVAAVLLIMGACAYALHAVG